MGMSMLRGKGWRSFKERVVRERGELVCFGG